MRWRRRKEPTRDELVAQQLALNRETWAAVQAAGVTDGTELRLDFFFDAPSSGAAEELAAFLRAETDYEVHVEGTEVSGTTQPTAVSADVLDEWVEWLVLAGVDHGTCDFDGWGAAIPERPPEGS